MPDDRTMPEAPISTVPMPRLGARVPRRGNAVSRALGRAVLRAMGWRFEGGLPDRPKFVIAVAPHTSNWDFVVGVFARQALGLGAHYLGKDTLFKPPVFGQVMKWLGGTPVNRHVRGGVVEQVAEVFRERDAYVLALAPEGTRKRVEAWRTGFYYIALEAGVPISLVTFDYGRKRVIAGPSVQPSGDLEADLERMQTFFEGVTPKKIEGAG